MNVLFHVGYHKTGTTFLQEILFPADDRLSVVPRSDVQRTFLLKGSFHFQSEAARALITDWTERSPTGVEWLVVSDEELSGNIHTGGNGGYLAKEVADRIWQIWPSAHVLIVVRNQVEMIESVYRQYVKRGGTFGIHRYLSGHGGLPHRFPQFCFEHFEYDKLIDHYQQRFGGDRVHVYAFEDMQRDSSSFVETMFRDLGMIATWDMDQYADTVRNPSYPPLSVYLARCTNRFYGADPINRRVILNVPGLYPKLRRLYTNLARLPRWARLEWRRPFFVTGALRDSIQERYADSNQTLRELTGIELQYPGDHREPD